jgi:hypothetical protein
MSDYVKSTDFASKDTLPSGDSAKIVRGTEIDAEFEALEVAIASKANTSDVSSTYAPLNSPAFTGSPVLPTGTTAVTQSAGDNDTSVATTAFVTTAVAALGYPSFKNRIINGAMMIDQRNAGASVTSSANGTYFLDRWRNYQTANSKFSVQQSSTAPTGFTKSMLITSLSAYSIGAGDILAMDYRIEGNNVADLAWGTASAAPVTLSFWVRSSLTGTFGGAVSNSAGNRSYPFSYTVNSANTFEYKTVTIAGDTSGTWLTDTGVGIELFFSLGTGSTYSGATGSWAGAQYISATGATSVVGTNGATFYITGVQLEKGSTATSFDYRPYGTELALCQRYFETFGGGSNVMLPGSGTWASTTNAVISLVYTVQKRSSPTMSYAGTVSSFEAVNEGVAWKAASSIAFAGTGTNATEMTIATTGGGSQGQGARFRVVATSAFVQASAEL